MYQNFNDIGKTHVHTDDKKYSCVSVPYGNFLPYQTTVPTFYNREYFNNSLPNGISDDNPFYDSESSNNLFINPESNSSDSQPIELYSKIKNSNNKNIQNNNNDSEDYLLPVLDCRFNLREICKQSILLEDHLSHDKKRCQDCCIKHFLALEGLSEEAITLDKDAKHLQDLKDIPDKIREIQKLWFQDPDKNSHICSQMLRQLRKRFMQNTFDIIFNSKNQNKEGMCGGGLCKIKK